MMLPGKAPHRLALSTLTAILFLTLACGKQGQPASASANESKPSTPSAEVASAQTPTPDTAADSDALKPNIDGNHVMQYVKEIVAIGPRPVGSPGHAKLEQYIKSKLTGDDVEDDSFSAK